MREVDQPIDAPLLRERYRPLTLLGRGGSALVYQGIDETLQRPVAIKVFKAGTNFDRYRKELRLLAGLSHHGVVSIVDAGLDESTPDDPRPFLVMELVSGRTLGDALQADRLPPRQVGEIGYEIAEALDYVHSQGVIHRDITPWNVMLTDYGSASSRSRARLTDFGIAIDSTYVHAAEDAVTGTAAYLSPEQVRNLPLTPATDIYSLGLVMLEGFTGTVAFPGEEIKSALSRLNVNPPIPKTVDKAWRPLMSAMTLQQSEERPSAAEVARDIRTILRKRR
ncbi:MAG: hypothetical protein JWQ43_15 [Glaciihabitans sp.]|nr:hypothetical protein [Glaciihabitans sp.]